jgi:hypothetical protein
MPLKRLVLSVALMLLVFCSTFRVPFAGDAIPDVEQRMRRDIQYLASDELEGRGVGLKGLDLAADYIRAEFAKAGLNVTAVKGDAFQKFEMTAGAVLKEPNSLELRGPDGKQIELKINSDFTPQSFGGSGKIDAELVFCGYGVESNDAKYNDFDGLDVTGKVVVLMRRIPRQADQATQHSLGRQADLGAKVSAAASKGVAGIVFVNDPYSGRKDLDQAKQQLTKQAENVVAAADELESTDAKDNDKLAAARAKLSDAVKKHRSLKAQVAAGVTDPLMKFGYGSTDSPRSIPIFHITRAVFDQVLKSVVKKDLTEIEAEIDKDLKPRSAVLTGWTAVGETSIEHRKVEVKNVIGVIEGEGPQANETVVIGAHYDHVGRGGAGSRSPGSNEIHNGADDNASGTAGLIELARQFGSRKNKLHRRLVFIAFTGEERGLHGSKHYVEKPLFPLDQTIAMLNLDMVGRMSDEKLHVYGVKTSLEWEKILDLVSTDAAIQLVKKPEGFGPSDHSSFYKEKIPVLHFFTGTHPDYHRPTDDWDKINFTGMVRIVSLVERISSIIASQERLQYQFVPGSADIQRSGERPYFGSIPDFERSDGNGYALAGVSPQSPAEIAGFKKGDVIVEFGNRPITNVEDFDSALRIFPPGTDVEVVLLRGTTKLKLKVVLGRPSSS